jgi:hypothetical protein
MTAEIVAWEIKREGAIRSKPRSRVLPVETEP